MPTGPTQEQQDTIAAYIRSGVFPHVASEAAGYIARTSTAG